MVAEFLCYRGQEKSLTLTLTEWLMLPLVPETTTVQVTGQTCAWKLRVDEPDPPMEMVKLVGLTVALRPEYCASVDPR